MSGNRVKLTNGDRWTAQQFLDHYFKPAAPSTPAVAVDMPWYMSDGPGRYYHPGMFPIIESTINRRDLALGRYDLWKLAPLKQRDPSVKAGITHYLTDPGSSDYKTRAWCSATRVPEYRVTSSSIQMGPRHSSELKSGQWTRILISVTTIGRGCMSNLLARQQG